MSLVTWIEPGAAPTFPPVALALSEPNGLLAVGGDLTTERLLAGYRHGVFPWYSDGEPILWWSPDPRAVLFPDRLRVSRSLRKTLKRRAFQVTMDRAFDAVIAACAAPRPGAMGTWITAEMTDAYVRLHRIGYAHSVECWQHGELVGGLYGVSIGAVFSGESMFSRRPDASKVALVALARHLRRWGYRVIDCQLYSEHLGRLGAENIPRSRFLEYLGQSADLPGKPGSWATQESFVEPAD